MTMIERVAQAFYKHFFEGDWPPETEVDIGMGADDFREAARAAIEAMREPTEAMAETVVDDDDAKAIWRDMIDAALKEGE